MAPFSEFGVGGGDAAAIATASVCDSVQWLREVSDDGDGGDGGDGSDGGDGGRKK